ncbi:MAG: MaoC family dehydratase N-terminal domain-containing protein [Desulfobacterota bacterium]|jgi:acyl dehydratase|nr:MaoC family dehydratase N-terminal domain-containing protein [Thermodesulfobacteriota bacterium]
MELSSRFVGTLLKDYQTEITWRQTMNFAAAVDDNNDVYMDDEREGGIIAPPMFSVAVTWRILDRIWEYIEAKDFPMEVLMTQVHHTEALEFHRPLRPGDRLTVKGQVAAILPHRAGTRVVMRFDALDQAGEPVFTEHMGALMRGVKCADEGSSANRLPEGPLIEERTEPLWESRIPIDPLRPHLYDGCTDIVFPIHTSKAFAHQVGLRGIILQGTATLAYAVREIINREAGGDPLALKFVFCRFTGMVVPGTAIRVQLVGKSVKQDGTDLHFNVLNQEGQKAISNGYVFLKEE